ARLAADGVPLRLILVPHEPTPPHLARTEAALDAHALPHARLSSVEAGGPVPAVTLVDRVGVLGDLYALADLAYVGGGFGTAGLHSVLEPAAFGAPVIIGPRHANAREAAELIAHAAAFEVTGADDLAETIRRLTDTGLRQRSGSAARAYAEAGRGAALRGARVIERLLDGGPSARPTGG
ncbi:MAG: 3-deoxy-D-manno-octulosonic acid transferase(EC, partial [uncultured Gemmatimonadetes bacterium]